MQTLRPKKIVVNHLIPFAHSTATCLLKRNDAEKRFPGPLKQAELAVVLPPGIETV
jgi:hypothetical protein